MAHVDFRIEFFIVFFFHGFKYPIKPLNINFDLDHPFEVCFDLFYYETSMENNSFSSLDHE